MVLIYSCEKDTEEDDYTMPDFGNETKYDVSVYTSSTDDYTTAYYPSAISDMEKVPVIFFISGWYGSPTTSDHYDTLLRFMAAQGYIVIYTDEGSTTNHMYSINKFEEFLSLQESFLTDELKPKMDFDKIGVVGHSAGGGLVFTAMKYFSEKGYGNHGRFVFAIEPWFAFGMDEADMQNLPSNLRVIIQQYGPGGNNPVNGTDARIPLTEYALLTSIDPKYKDYQVYENADHHYPTGTHPLSEMYGLLKPLHALMEYTFVHQSEEVRKEALELGSDDPYANGNGIQQVLDQYQYPCDGANTLIDYCSIVP
jgi:hypothetical protein